MVWESSEIVETASLFVLGSCAWEDSASDGELRLWLACRGGTDAIVFVFRGSGVAKRVASRSYGRRNAYEEVIAGQFVHVLFGCLSTRNRGEAEVGNW